MSTEIKRTKSSLFPPPPPFYHLYTDETKPLIPATSASSSSSSSSSSSNSSWIWQPPPPLTEPFTKFNKPQFHTLQVQKLSEHKCLLVYNQPCPCKGKDTPRLYEYSETISSSSPSSSSLTSDTKQLQTTTTTGQLSENESGKVINFSQELRKLNKQILDTYIAILDAIVVDHTLLDGLLTHFFHLLQNSTYLLSLLRPHQSRQAIITLLQRQIKTRNNKAAALEKIIQDTKAYLSEHNITFPDENGPSAKVTDPALGKESSVEQESIPMTLAELVSIKNLLDDEDVQMQDSNNNNSNLTELDPRSDSTQLQGQTRQGVGYSYEEMMKHLNNIPKI